MAARRPSDDFVSHCFTDVEIRTENSLGAPGHLWVPSAGGVYRHAFLTELSDAEASSLSHGASVNALLVFKYLVLDVINTLFPFKQYLCNFLLGM